MSRFISSIFPATVLALLTGCPNLKPIAQSAPAATPPQIDSARGFHCWRNLTDCYARVVDARPETEPSNYNFRFFIKYHILNQLTVSVNGEEAIRTELAQPPSGGAYFFVSEPDTTVDGLATSQVVVYPRRAPPDSLRRHERAFSFCGTCTGQAAYGDMEGASTACTEGEARSALQSSNPGCTFAAGQLQQFAFCKQCPNGSHGEDYAYACSESSARGHLTAGSPGCTFNSGACR